MEGSDGRFKPSILLVEDDPLTRGQLGELLSEHFPRLSVADNGEHGLKLYRERRPDIVITDILMPVMDGMEMARAILKMNPRAQIVIITAYDEIADSADADRLTVDYALKPIDFDALLETINRCKDRILADDGSRAQ
jgi:two-component system cell cycle response regulator